MLDATGTAAIEPAIRMDVAGAVHYELDCHLAPDRLMASLQRRLQAAGVKFHWNTPVSGFIHGVESHSGGEDFRR